LLIHEFVKRCLGKRNRTPNYLRKIAQYGKVVFALFVHLLILTGTYAPISAPPLSLFIGASSRTQHVLLDFFRYF
jgi:hypothetical protein